MDPDDDEAEDSLLPLGVKRADNPLFRGQYIVLGLTGSWKTTFCSGVTSFDKDKFLEVGMGGGIARNTRGFKDFESPLFTVDSSVFTPSVPGVESFSFNLKDTVGLGAADIKSEGIIEDTFNECLNDDERVNAFILVHKYDRLRQDFVNQELIWMRNMIQLFEADLATTYSSS